MKINRRNLLLGSAALLVLPDWTHGVGSGGFPAVFQGNPNATITSIDVSGGIVADTTSGQLPAFVQVSASAVTASGSTVGGVLPFQDLEFSWDFGDPSGTETFTSYKVSPSGVTVNANNAQTGPEARYVYRNAGTYTITLRVRGKNGGGFTTATQTMTFTASTFTKSGGEWWYDSNATGANNGTSPTNAFTSISTLSTKASVNSTAIHIAKASSFSGSTNLDFGAVSGVRIDTYGSGAKPLINISSGAVTPLRITNTCSDIVISGVTFGRTGGTQPDDGQVLQCAGTTQVMAGVYFDNTDFTTNQAGNTVCIFMQYQASVANAANLTRGGFWNCNVTNSQTQAATLGVYNMPYQWGFFYGGSVSGAGGDDTRDHHIYPNTRLHSCYRYINFGLGPARNFCINGNYDPIGEVTTPEVAQWHVMAECNFTGVHRAYDASNGDNAPAESIFKDVVIQQNLFNGLDLGLAQCDCLETATERDNFCWNCNTNASATTLFQIQNSSGAAINRLYRNNIYKPAGGGSPTDAGIISYSGASTNPIQCTDNNIQDQRSGFAGDIVEAWNGATATTLKNAGSLFARNGYFGPNTTFGFWTDDVTTVAFAAWATAVASESSSSFTNGANGAWPNAASGIFS